MQHFPFCFFFFSHSTNRPVPIHEGTFLPSGSVLRCACHAQLRTELWWRCPIWNITSVGSRHGLGTCGTARHCSFGTSLLQIIRYLIL